MAKISTSMKCNHFCPQSLFLYGTYREDGTPNFGLFCWFSYYWDEDLGVMACIGDTKLTKDLIRKNGVFPQTWLQSRSCRLQTIMAITPGMIRRK